MCRIGIPNPSSWNLQGDEGFRIHGFYSMGTQLRAGQTTIWVNCPKCEEEHQLDLFPEGAGYRWGDGWFQHDLCAEAIEALFQESALFSILRIMPAGEYYYEPFKEVLERGFFKLAQKAKEKGSLQ